MRGKPMSLRWKLVLVSLAISTVAQLLAGTVLTIHDNQSFRAETSREAHVGAAMLASTMAAPLDFNDVKAAQDYLVAYKADPDIDAAGVYDAQGEQFAAFVRVGKGFLPAKALPEGETVGWGLLGVSYPVTEGGRVLGSVYLQRSVEPFGAWLLRYGLLLLVTLVGSLLIAAPIALRLNRAISEPIMRIAAASVRIAKGDLSERIQPSERQDEIGALIRSFRSMVGSLREMTAELENRVKERTEQLEIAYLELQEAHLRERAKATDLTRLNEELSRARIEADEANRAKANFLAAMSHEIRTPMNGVIGMIDVLHQSSLKGYQVEMVDLIRESALALLTIIDDILDFSKIEAGRLDIESEPMSIAREVESAAGLMDRLACKKDVELTLFVDPALPEQVFGDPLRLRQIIINLANNAVKFSSGGGHEGQVSIRAELVEWQPGRVEVAIHVTDNGIGMDEQTQQKLFTPFTQADASTTRRFGGTGLGLAISLNLAERMGGRIEVQSALGEGARFTLRLPFEVPAESDSPGQSTHIEGLNCLVIGPPDSLAPDMAVYLAAGGAKVERIEATEGISELLPLADGAARIWVFDVAAGPNPDFTSLDSSIGLLDAVVVIGRGTRRHARLEKDGTVRIDGNVMTRAMLYKAVAIAAGRDEDEEGSATTHGRQESAFRIVSRDEALQSGRLILVAEDNETNQKVIQRQMALLGYAADIVDNGALALERWSNCPYALLLTDLHMPEMDGYQLAREIRSQEQNGSHMPIIALTANAQRNEIYRCRSVGIDDHLIKPAQLSELQAMVEKWLPPDPSNGEAAPLSREPAVSAVEPGKAPFDMTVLAGLVGDDPDILRDFLADYHKSTTAIAASLRTAYRLTDMAGCAEAAHKLASSAEAVGAKALSTICRQIEQAGRTRRGSAVAGLMRRFEAEIDAMEAYLGPGPAIDLSRLAAICGTSDRGVLDQMLAEYLAATAESMIELRQAAEKGDMRGIASACHGACGEARSAGATILAERLAALENRMKAGEMDGLEAMLSGIEAEMERVRTYVEARTEVP